MRRTYTLLVVALALVLVGSLVAAWTDARRSC